MNKIAQFQKDLDLAKNLFRISMEKKDETMVNYALGIIVTYQKVLKALTSIECPVCKDSFHNEQDQDYINKNGLCISCDHKTQEMYAS